MLEWLSIKQSVAKERSQSRYMLKWEVSTPIILLPKTIQLKSNSLAESIAGSITLGAGQFCTKSGLLLLIDNEKITTFIQQLGEQFNTIPGSIMSNKGICINYYSNRSVLEKTVGVIAITTGENMTATFTSSPALHQTTAKLFIESPIMQEEIFSPSSLIVLCADIKELQSVINSLQGQLTATIFAEKDELVKYTSLGELLIEKAGRVIYNNIPTGVEESKAIRVHEGPYPASSSVNSTSVGGDAIFRFLRPVCLQNFPDEICNIV